MNAMDDEREGFLMTLANKALDTALSGFGPFASAKKLATGFLRNGRYRDDDARIDALIRSQCRLSGASGFVTGLGGGTTLIVGGAAADLVSVLAINIRMVAAIAWIRGYDLEDEAVRSALLLTAIGTGVEEALGNTGVAVGKAGCKALICKIPKKMLGRINKFFGRKLVTKFSQKGLIQLGKAVPFIGGFVGGAIDMAGCRSIGKLARQAFPALAAA